MKLKKIMGLIAAVVLMTGSAWAGDKGLHLGGMEKDAKKAAIEAKKAGHEAEQAKKRIEKEAKAAQKRAEAEAKKAAAQTAPVI